MKFFTKEIQGIVVTFFSIKKEVAWLVTVKVDEVERTYGDFVTIDVSKDEENQRAHAFDLLEDQAKATLAEVLRIPDEPKKLSTD